MGEAALRAPEGSPAVSWRARAEAGIRVQIPGDSTLPTDKTGWQGELKGRSGLRTSLGAAVLS